MGRHKSALEQDVCSQSSERNTAKSRYISYPLLLNSALLKTSGPTVSEGLKAVLCCSQLSFDIYCFFCWLSALNGLFVCLEALLLVVLGFFFSLWGQHFCTLNETGMILWWSGMWYWKEEEKPHKCQEHICVYKSVYTNWTLLWSQDKEQKKNCFLFKIHNIDWTS